MKPFLALLVLCALTFSACMSTSDTTLRAGAAETVITPEVEGMEVYEDLYARALVLADDRQRLAIVTADLNGVDFTYNEVLLGAINKATGIPKERIVINSSHSHNAPWPGDDEWKKGSPSSTFDVAPSYEGWLAGQIAELVKRAADNLQPATLRVGRAPAMIGYNRRAPIASPSKGAIVPWVDVLGAYGEDGKRIVALFSYAAHPVIIHFANWPNGAILPWVDVRKVHTLIGPDYPGYAVKHLRNLLSQEGVFMFAQGCGANINGFPWRGGRGAGEAAGLSLAFSVSRALADGKNVTSAPLKARSLHLDLPLQAPPSVVVCRELLTQQPNNPRLTELLKVAESGEPRFLPFPMRAFAVGDELCILSLPHEMFAEYQLFVNEISPFKHTLVFGYTNGCESYVAMKKDYDLGLKGGYEASPWGAALTYPHRLPLQPSAEQLIKEGITHLLSELKLD